MNTLNTELRNLASSHLTISDIRLIANSTGIPVKECVGIINGEHSNNVNDMFIGIVQREVQKRIRIKQS